MRKAIFVGVLSILLPVTAFAQVNATVVGTVADGTGALIPGVEVTAKNVNTGIATIQITNETGTYQFASLQPGAYQVSAALASFQTQTYQNVTLSQGQQIRLNFTLQVASVGQSVEVVTDADVALATTSASVGDVLPVREVQSLPLVVRDVLGLINATAGTAGRNFGGQGTRALNVTRDGLLINDARYGTAAQNGTFVSSDLVEEVQVVVGNVDPEAGRGSGQVTLQTRSGTNEFHGAAFAFNNNSRFNAQNYFENLVGATKSYINRNQYGGRVGGPIIRNKAFFFVLVDEQRWLQKENFVAQVLTDPARQGAFRYISGQRNGNALSATPSVDLNGNILNPAALRSFNLFTDVQDPYRTGISTNAFYRDNWLIRMPHANDYTVGDGLNTAGFRWTRRMSGLSAGNNVGNENNRDQLNLRFDYQINNNNKATFTTTREEDWGYRPDGIQDWPGGVDVKDRFIPHLYTVAWISNLSSTILNEMRYARKETGYERRSAFEDGCCYTRDEWNDRSPEAQKLYDLIPKSNGYPLWPIGSSTSFGATSGLCCWMKHGFASTRGNRNPTQQFSNTLSWVSGPHSFKVGFETVKNWSNGWNTTSEQVPTTLFGNGNFPVTGITSTRFPGLNAADINTATDILNDLAGSIGGITMGRVINSAKQTTWNDYANGDFRRWRMLTQRDWAVFFKDTWNASTNLTLNFGLRYDKYGVLYEQQGMLARAKGGEKALYNYATNGTLTESLLVGPNSTNPDQKFYKDDWNNFGPAFGFSYRIPWLTRATVIRGGSGINYAGLPVLLDFENDFGNSPGSVDVYLPASPYVPTVYTSYADALTRGVIPLPAQSQPGIIVLPLSSKNQIMNTPTDDRATPYIQSFNLAVQRDLSRGLSLEVTYIGNKGTKLFGKRSINEPEMFTNGILSAFNETRAGGNSALFDRLLMGLSIPGVGIVNGSTITGSQAFRRWSSTRGFLANGSVSQFANFVSTTSAATGIAGGLLTNAGLPQSFITSSPQFSDARLWATDKNSTYHSLQLQIRKQLSQGVSGQFSYTWSKALGDTVAGETGTNSIDPKNLGLNKGRQAFDQTHALVGHGTWELPFGAGRAYLGSVPGWADRIVGGWQLSSIFGWTSGNPLSVSSPVRTVGTLTNLSLPDIVGDFPKSLGQVHVGDGFAEYFSGIKSVTAPTTNLFGADPDRLASFSTNLNVVDGSGKVLLTNPQPGKVGTLGQRWIEGPAQTQIDLSLAKRIVIRENVAVILRADAVNALNITNWGDPNVNINSPDFGRITGLATDATARRFTFTARVEF